MLLVAHRSDPCFSGKSRVARRLAGCSSMAKVGAVRLEETWPKEGALRASVGVPSPLLFSGRQCKEKAVSSLYCDWHP